MRAVLKLLHNTVTWNCIDVLVQVRVPLPCGRPWLSRLPVYTGSSSSWSSLSSCTDSLLEPARTVPAHGLLSLTHVLLWAPPTCSVPAYQRAMGLQQLLQTLSASLRRAVTQPLETAERRCRIMACNLAVIRGAQLATSRDLTPLPAPELVGIPSWGIPGAAVSNDLIENGILWMAVPKKRTSHSKKRMRMAQKWLKPIRHYNFCPACGNPKLYPSSVWTLLQGDNEEDSQDEERDGGTAAHQH